MRAVAILVTAFCSFGVGAVYADSTTASVQQTLKDQGFYYGEITGTKDADTTAAIRRYQIRNGLQITGELNAETRKSLGLQATAPIAPATPAPVRPAITPRPEPPDSRESPPSRLQEPSVEDDDEFDSPPGESPGYAPGDRRQDASALFLGTPYEIAPPELQRRIILGAQSLLARRGYYRSGIDGVYGPGTEFAVRAYQSRFGIEPSGRLDMETLAALGLLPGQQAPGVTAPSSRALRPRPSFIGPGGERIYVPRL